MGTTCMVEHDHGCGFLGGLVRRLKFQTRKHSLPSTDTYNNKNSNETVAHAEHANSEKLVQSSSKISSRRVSDAARNSNATTTTTISSSSSGSSNNLAIVKVGNVVSKIRTNPNSNCNSYPQNTDIFRVSSGNILKLSPTKGLRTPGNENSPKKSVPNNMSTKTLECKGTMGNILRGKSDEMRSQSCMKLDPMELKSMGNEKYKEGKFDKALVLYDQAIALDSKMASCRCNKSAALMALGKLVEAVIECKEAVKIDPLYHRAHHRLGTLFFRLGYPDEALQHFGHSGSISNFLDINQAKALKTCLGKCTDAKEHKDWTALLRQTQNAFALGAESALQVYALQAQALLTLLRHDEAYAIFRRKPYLDMDSYTRLFGQERSTFVFLIEAQIYTATGRFEDAVITAQKTLQLNPNNKDLKTILINAQSMSMARSKGNNLFKELKFLEACNAYSEGLEYNPYNSILLCNRAACRSKLGQFEKALEDCSQALSLQPTYSKARLRRAHCNGQLGRWEASVQDYEILIREKPGDEEVGRALFEAKVQLKKQWGEDVKDMKFGTDVVLVTSIECFRNSITSPGMSVVLFCNKSNQEKALPLMEQVRLRFPSINFLKVEVEDHPYLTKSESVSYIPAFKIYKNGSKIRDIPGNNLDLLETSIKLYS